MRDSLSPSQTSIIRMNAAFRSVRLAAIAALVIFALAAAAPAYEGGGPVTTGGTITGVVTLEGAAPAPQPIEISKDRDVCGAKPLFDEDLVVGKDNGIANAVVTIADITGGAPLKPLSDVKFDQRGCRYEPHVLAFPAGSSVDIINSDGILHSVRTESKLNPPIDMAQPGFKHVITVTVDKPEVIHVSCDAHNWMEGWWYVTANPYYAVTDADGHFTINNVPPGAYKLKVWQEKLGVDTRSITVKPGETTTVDFALKQK